MAYLQPIDSTAALEVVATHVIGELTLAQLFRHDQPDPVAMRKTRIVVHIVATGQDDRAQLARMIFAAGYHAEVYSDAAELLSHRPTDGVALIDG